jgi:hypothetical protein
MTPTGPGVGREMPLLAALAVVAVGVVAAAMSRWRVGASIVGIGFALAGFLRLLLPARRAGLLAVRSRRLDVAVLVALGGALVVLASSVPDA